MITTVKVEDAVGMILAHDITRIVPGFKGPAFRRGHLIQEEDIPEFLKIGKEHVFILKLEKGEVHEEEAALRIAAAVAGPGLTHTGTSEGRVNLKAAFSGLVRINVPALEEINSMGEIIIATVHDGTICQKDMTVAGTRIIPLYMREEKLAKLEQICRANVVIDVIPLPPRKIGLIVLGSEVYKGRIKDRFTSIIEEKVAALGSTIIEKTVLPDDSALLARTIIDFRSRGSEIILTCGGMSVDPDDLTPEGIRKSGASVVFYGLPVLPGAMLLYAMLGETPILGVPACVLHAKTTALDILFPRVLAGEKLTLKEVGKMGHGSLCLRCPECAFPVCPFGK